MIKNFAIFLNLTKVKLIRSQIKWLKKSFFEFEIFK